MTSLASRLLLAASVVIAVFLGTTGWALSQAVQKSRLQAVEDALTAHVYTLLVGLETDADGNGIMQQEPPIPELGRAGTGLMARMLGTERRSRWRSLSALGRQMPPPPVATPGRMVLSDWSDAAGHSWRVVSIGILLEGSDTPVWLQVARDKESAQAEIDSFKQRLWILLAILAVGLLFAQWAVLQWGLRPLRSLRHEVARIESGDKPDFTAAHVSELAPLVESLNGLLRTGRAQQQRYANALGELAHSLKTPLAVIHASLETGRDIDTLHGQVRRIDDIVRYQLNKAAASGKRSGRLRVDVTAAVEELLQALRKICEVRGITLSSEVAEELSYNIDRGDLMELIGNVLDNACKWANATVRLTVSGEGGGLHIVVEDDGPGIAEADVHRVLQRGARADESRDGQGIGLAVVHQLIQSFSGELRIERSTDLGGACIRMHLA